MGANIAFYVQHPKFIQFARSDIVLSNEMRMALGLSIVEELVNFQYTSGEGVRALELSRRFKMPMMAVQNMLDALEKGHIIVPSEDPDDNRAHIYYPAKPLEKMTLGEIIKAIRSYSERSGFNENQIIKAPNTIKILEDLEKAQQSTWARKASEIFKNETSGNKDA
jgi:membrane protein